MEQTEIKHNADNAIENNKKRNDILLIVGILIGMAILAVVVWLVFFQGSGTKAVVMVNDRVIFEQELTMDCQLPIQTEAGYNILQIQNGEVRILEADCREQICVEHISINKKGETIVCLPHKLVVEVQ